MAAIHMLATQLGMDTADRSDSSDYRAMLKSQTGASSAADLDDRKRKQLIAYLARCLKPEDKRQRSQLGDRQQALIERLWAELADAGVVRDRSTHGLAAFIKRMHGVESARWLTVAQSTKVIEALKAWKARGVSGS